MAKQTDTEVFATDAEITVAGSSYTWTLPSARTAYRWLDEMHKLIKKSQESQSITAIMEMLDWMIARNDGMQRDAKRLEAEAYNMTEIQSAFVDVLNMLQLPLGLPPVASNTKGQTKTG